MTEERALPARFYVFVSVLWCGLITAFVLALRTDPAMGTHLWTMVAFIALFATAELLDLSYHEKDATLGLSQCESILLPMIVALSFGEVLVAAVAGMGLARAFDRSTNLGKQVFNLAQYGCAAAAASFLYVWLTVESGRFSIAEAGAATIAVIVFEVLTHSFVAAALHVAGRGRFMDAFTDVAPVTFINLAGNVILGLLLAAAFSAEAWTIALFPLASIALFLGYRAVVRQQAERRRMVRLHEASRALAAAPDLGRALDGFLKAVAKTASALGARAVVRMNDGYHFSGVHEGETVEILTPLGKGPVGRFLDIMEESRKESFDETDVAELLKVGPVSRNLIGVPLIEDDRVTGLLAVVDRVGADEFGSGDVSFLRALANELSMTLHSYRLYGEVTEEREKFHLLVDAVSDYAIYLLDTRGRVVSWNQGAARIFGYEADQIIGRHFSSFYSSSDETWKEELSTVEGVGRLELEGMRLRNDGTRFMVNEVVSPVFDDENEMRGFAKVTRDISELVKSHEEREELQSRLNQSQRLESVGQLAGGIAHDFNNLLSVILNCSHFLIDRLEEPDPLRNDVLEIKAAAQRASSLTRQLLIFSRREMVQTQLVNLNDVIAELEKLLSRAIGEDIAVRTTLFPELPSIEADPGQIEQVLMNLAVNARDAMPGGGMLLIETCPIRLDDAAASRFVDLPAGNYVSLRVMDTGSGMPPEVVRKAFDPFFTTKPEGQGTGLGLATVYGIVKGVSGHLTIDSVEGAGTTFEILFPVSETAVIRVEPQIAEIEVRGNGEVILLVEDERSLRAIGQRILTEHGFEVVEARNGREALFILEANGRNVDLLLSDIVMPEMSGVELFEQVQGRWPALPVALMSGYNPHLVAGELVDCEVLPKPFEPNDLLGFVKRMLERKPAGAN
ncbi:MAG TPA: ATP-binding protein [Actinomycetota bacterium]|nr:ATP-binding protein [Actinomycetota bacterium]